jgi:hypothetical protein
MLTLVAQDPNMNWQSMPLRSNINVDAGMPLLVAPATLSVLSQASPPNWSATD